MISEKTVPSWTVNGRFYLRSNSASVIATGNPWGMHNHARSSSTSPRTSARTGR